jgi:hypothetical protein
MARVIKSNIKGTLDGLTFYTRKDSAELFVRTKGGVSKERIKKDPRYKIVRYNNTEFGGCACMAKSIRSAYSDISHLADTYLSPSLCALAKRIQKEDLVGILGQRPISLSLFSRFLVGIELRKTRPLASLFALELMYNIDRESGSAAVDLSAFTTKFAFRVPNKHPYFRITATLGWVCDQVFSDIDLKYRSLLERDTSVCQSANSPWYPATASVPQQQLKMEIKGLATSPLIAEETLILCIALEYATVDPFGLPCRINGEGAGRIVAVG